MTDDSKFNKDQLEDHYIKAEDVVEFLIENGFKIEFVGGKYYNECDYYHPELTIMSSEGYIPPRLQLVPRGYI